MPGALRTMLMKRRMRWLGHVCQMSDTRRFCLESWSAQAFSWTKVVIVPLDSWYELTSDRSGWYQLYTGKISNFTVCQQPRLQSVCGSFGCGCGQVFHCQGDLTCHSEFCDGQPRNMPTHFECHMWTGFSS